MGEMDNILVRNTICVLTQLTKIKLNLWCLRLQVFCEKRNTVRRELTGSDTVKVLDFTHWRDTSR